MDLYRSAAWKVFRAEVIEADGGICVRCNRSGTSQGVILQVHHRQYLPGRKPWEYPRHLCETLCRGCHAKEHGLITPTDGWVHVGFDDLGGLDGNCEYCGTEIRYVYLVEHAKWFTMEVGEICCDKLTCTDVATSHARIRERTERREKQFISSTRWKNDSNGDSWIRQASLLIGVVKDGASYRLKINNRRGKITFETSKSAKIKAFELIESGAAADYFKKKKSG